MLVLVIIPIIYDPSKKSWQKRFSKSVKNTFEDQQMSQAAKKSLSLSLSFEG